MLNMNRSYSNVSKHYVYHKFHGHSIKVSDVVINVGLYSLHVRPKAGYEFQPRTQRRSDVAS